ncbi:MAG TPA: non-heme iron oxygenase ferredoxin subunit, partial [Thermomicrobiales bacterium]|nr:non-heme iron oxygenase ferredoxin subunit [Thermomicrobiales bacterium]
MEFVKVAGVGEIAPGTALLVEVGDEPIAVFNLDGEFYAICDTCSHEEASLSEGDIFGDVVECPLHGSQFDIRTGKVLTLPAVLPVASYEVK